ncbi:hypothetical protein D3C78_1303660 [compost metagenome]
MLGEPPIGVLSTGTLSIMISGSLLAFKEAPPRIRIVDVLPGAPLIEVTVTPAIRPEIAS